MTADLHLIADETKSSVAAVCRTLGVPRSSYYARRGRVASSRAKETAELDVTVKATFERHRGRYGSPRIHQVLRREGRCVGRKRVAKRMREMGLRARSCKRFQRTSQYGWAYLAILIDLCTRAVVGWAVSTRCNAALARKALDAAVARHRPAPGLLHHTDRGATYTAKLYRDRLHTYRMRQSMSRRGNCWDNAVAELTFSTIKTELLHDVIPEDVHHVRRLLFPYIEHFYNHERLHSSIDYLTPSEKERLISDNALVA